MVPLLAPLFALLADPIPVGKSTVEFEVSGTKLEVFTHKPRAWKGERLLVVLHGLSRNAEQYRDNAIAMAERFDALLVAPFFDKDRFPTRRYQRGGILGEDRKPAPREEWTYTLLGELVEAVRKREKKPDMPFWVIGHSAGGQFAMRMAAFHTAGAQRIVAANPGSTLFPSREMPFGYGFGGLPEELSSDAVLERYLAAPLTLYLGTDDDKPDSNFDSTPDAMKQGEGRLQRGRAAYEAARKLAEERGWKLNWILVEAEGVGHNHKGMFDHAACKAALLGQAPTRTPTAPAAKGSRN